MTLDQFALEEFGLAPLWVRRGGRPDGAAQSGAREPADVARQTVTADVADEQFAVEPAAGRGMQTEERRETSVEQPVGRSSMESVERDAAPRAGAGIAQSAGQQASETAGRNGGQAAESSIARLDEQRSSQTAERNDGQAAESSIARLDEQRSPQTAGRNDDQAAESGIARSDEQRASPTAGRNARQSTEPSTAQRTGQNVPQPRQTVARATEAPTRENSTPNADPSQTDDDYAWFDDLPGEPPVPAGGRTTESDTALPAVDTLDWDALGERVAACRRCRLCEKRTNTVFGVGDREADWMLIGEAPGENEDRQGEPFVGQAGKLLDNMLRSLSLARGTNVYIANVIKCRPPGNRNPEPDEVARCEPYLQRQVALVKPKLIVALGRFAAQSLLKTEASISSLRGRVHEYQGVPVIVTYHPAYLLRSLHDKAKAWQDLCLARDTWQRPSGAARDPGERDADGAAH
jgi:uracil-DNA glycosylase family 4